MKTIKTENLRALAIVGAIVVVTIFALTFLQTAYGDEGMSFDDAHKHEHTSTTTIEGRYLGRQNVAAALATAYLLGNAFTVETPAGPKQFYREFFAHNDGPIISMLESRPNTRLSVTYDPECRYATAISFIAPPQQNIFIDLEAEEGILAEPMAITFDPSASSGAYISSPINSQGTLTFNVTLGNAGNFVIWARVLVPTSTADSLFVSVDDGPEDIYDAGEGTWSNAWQWTRVNGRNGGVPLTLSPRVFSLSAGTHKITFRAREVNTKLDRLVITNDLAYVVSDDTPMPTPTPTPTPLPSPTPVGTPVPVPTPLPSPSPALICAGTWDAEGTLRLTCPRVNLTPQP